MDHKVDFSPACDLEISAFANATEGKIPLNALRHTPTDTTTGWFVWCGEYSSSKDFFQPIHTVHLYEKYPTAAKLFGLPPGYRFLLAGDHLDIWFDLSLLKL